MQLLFRLTFQVTSVITMNTSSWVGINKDFPNFETVFNGSMRLIILKQAGGFFLWLVGWFLFSRYLYPCVLEDM